VTVVSDVPARAEGLQLIGEMRGSGYRVPPALVRRGDGQTLQLTPLLYAVLAAADGRRGYDEMADCVQGSTGKPVSADNVRQLVDEQLRPLGLLLRVDGSAPELKRSNPLLGLRAKVAVTDPVRTRRLTDPFRVLFHPLVWVPLMVAFAVICWWLLLDKGLASATYEAFERPGLLLLVFAVTVLSAGFHEFGHAAAARRGGAQPGVMGAGVYLVWPAFYTDVTDSYRLGRLGRIRTDLGGLYFNAIVAVAIAAVWWGTRWDALLLVIATQILQMVRQLAPLVRFDGYHVLADLTGVPDLFPRIGPTLTSLWPTRWRDPRATELKPWARAVITVWVLLVVPLLAFTLLTVLLTLPRLVGTAWASVSEEWDDLTTALGDMEVVGLLASALSIVAFAFPALAIGVLLYRMARSATVSTWRRTEGRPFRRVVAGLTAAALAAGLVWAWWPSPDRYRPVLPFEGGTLTQAVATPLSYVGVDVPTSSAMSGGLARTVLPADMPLPTQDGPVPALVLVPSGTTTEAADQNQPADVAGSPPDEEVGTGDTGDTRDTGSEAPTWVFPFDRPLPPDEGDNQALAVNTTDDSVTYDVAMAMVWVDDDRALNTNEAVAVSSCDNCVSVAVAFQVVVIVGQADVVVPQNLSTAANYDCFECITAAVASQLVVTVDSLPGAQQQVALADLWEDVAGFAASIPTLSLAEITSRLDGYKAEILAILGVRAEELGLDADEPSSDTSPSTGTSPTATPTDGSSPTGSPSSSPTESSSSTAGTDEEASEDTDTTTGSTSDTDSATGSDPDQDSGTDSGSDDSTEVEPSPSPTSSTTSEPSPSPTSSP
jgi:putative peptide zinc metalloprotease protein